MAEYLAALEAQAAAQGDAPDDGAGSGPESKRPRRYERQQPKVISPSDPQSAWTAKANKRVQFGYGLNYLIDIENAVIVDVEATPARTYDEVAATRTMLDRTQERFNLKPKRLAADTAYGTGKFLGWLVKEKKIIPHIPVWEKSDRQDGIFSRSDFRWDRKRGVYICPNGKLLRTSGTVHDGRTLLYRASKRDCDVCPIRAKCCTNADARKICWRRTRFSASSLALDLTSEARTPNINLSRSVIGPRDYPVRCMRLRRIEFSVHTGLYLFVYNGFFEFPCHGCQAMP